MCTLSFIARTGGFLLGMNRDENRRRVRALPPTIHRTESGLVLHPSEPSGGTWIGCHESGATFALLNWYSVSNRASEPVSRGLVVPKLLSSESSSEADNAFECLPLARLNPFRLIGVFPRQRELIEWRWNLRHVSRRHQEWKPLQWSSSAFDEPEAQRQRSMEFERAPRQNSAPDRAWLRALHGSHEPSRGPFSTCMHRDDAETVSYTEVEFDGTKPKMSYSAAALCGGLGLQSWVLEEIPALVPTAQKHFSGTPFHEKSESKRK
jgi:hypothetical protein